MARQLTLTHHNCYRLGCYQAEAWFRVWRVLERRMPGASGDMLEGATAGLVRLLVCRKAGRMMGLSREGRRGVRPYNLAQFFHGERGA